MLIAQQKKKENIAEYILYLWQVEDIIRGFNFDLSKIEKYIISNYKVDEYTYQQIKDWYANLIVKMFTEKIEKKGHLSSTMQIIHTINNHHKTLLKQKPRNVEYNNLYNQQLSNLIEYRQLSNCPPEVSNIEICFNALYAILLLRLQKKEISRETLQAMEGFRKLIMYITRCLQNTAIK